MHVWYVHVHMHNYVHRCINACKIVGYFALHMLIGCFDFGYMILYELAAHVMYTVMQTA